jgi:hypothetical protein
MADSLGVVAATVRGISMKSKLFTELFGSFTIASKLGARW